MKSYTLTIEGIPVAVCQKNVKNLNLRVCPPDGEVRLSAPLAISEERIRLFLNEKIDWISRKQTEVRRRVQTQQPLWDFSGDVEILGEIIRIKTTQSSGKLRLRKIGPQLIEITVGTDSSKVSLACLVEKVALECLKEKIPPIIAKWQKVIGVQVKEWRIRKMKTRWGSCNPQARRIWINAEMSKKSLDCLEYVIVHEMVHLLERHHNARFYSLMDCFLPNWREVRARLRS